MTKEHTDRVGKSLTELRKARKLSQYELAMLSGVARETIANIERGAAKNLKLETIRSLCRALKQPLEALVSGRP
jgi:transcriptional regulator with XRE-family HTH domain